MVDVSVIIPSHNMRDLVGICIDSVLAQTAVPSEVIVVDDSIDDSAAVIEPYVQRTNGQVKLLRVEPCNVSEARNIGIERATKPLIAFLDADDIWLADKTCRQIALLAEDQQAAGAFCGLFTFRQGLDDMERKPWDMVKDRPSITEVLATQMIVSSAMLIRRAALGDIRFDETSGHGEDTVFSADIALAGPWRCDVEPMLARRLHGTQITANPWHMVWNTKTRAMWCRAHTPQIGKDTAEHLEQQLWKSLVEHVERRYWTRQLDELRSICRETARLCPAQYERSSLAGRRIYPRWVYRLRDGITPWAGTWHNHINHFDK